MFCPNCGTEIKEKKTFCPKCGSPLGVEAVQEDTKTVEAAASTESAAGQTSSDGRSGVGEQRLGVHQ